MKNFVGSFTTPLYILPSSHQVYTAPISQLHGNVCFFILPLPFWQMLSSSYSSNGTPFTSRKPNGNKHWHLCGFDSDFLKHHWFCARCKKNLFTGDIEHCRTPGCIRKKEKTDMNYFVTDNVQVQLKEIVERDGIWKANQDCKSTVLLLNRINGWAYSVKLQVPNHT